MNGPEGDPSRVAAIGADQAAASDPPVTPSSERAPGLRDSAHRQAAGESAGDGSPSRSIESLGTVERLGLDPGRGHRQAAAQADAEWRPRDPDKAGRSSWSEPPQEPAEPWPEHGGRQLHPLPPGLVELYGLLAVLFVLVPEWMAGGALFGFREGRRGSELPAPSGVWKRLPELRLASLNLAELRLLAGERGLIGYSRQNRQELTARLLRRLKAQP